VSESSILQVPLGAAARPFAEMPTTLADVECQHIVAALQQTGWRIHVPLVRKTPVRRSFRADNLPRLGVNPWANSL